MQATRSGVSVRFMAMLWTMKNETVYQFVGINSKGSFDYVSRLSGPLVFGQLLLPSVVVISASIFCFHYYFRYSGFIACARAQMWIGWRKIRRLKRIKSQCNFNDGRGFFVCSAKNCTGYWHSPDVLNLLAQYNTAIFHYFFGDLFRRAHSYAVIVVHHIHNNGQ